MRFKGHLSYSRISRGLLMLTKKRILFCQDPQTSFYFRVLPKALPAGFTDPDTYGFDQIAQNGVDTHVIPVYPRGTMVEPYVKNLASRLSSCIEEA